MIGVMSLRSGSHAVGPEAGTIQVHTYREGIAEVRDVVEIVIDVQLPAD